jgi:hypothetical protein
MDDFTSEEARGQPSVKAGPPVAEQRRAEAIPGVFQVALAIYILLTGTLPTILQAGAFGVDQGASLQFMVAMIVGLLRDLVLISALLRFSKHPMGILHPLVLAVIAWPLLTSMPSVIGDFGGWAGVIAGEPARAPFFAGLPGRGASELWLAVAKYGALQAAALLSTFAGFSMFIGRPVAPKVPNMLYQPVGVRRTMIGLIVISTLVLLFFIHQRGGLNSHLTSLGAGRFRELSGDGPIIVATHLGALAIFVWIAAVPSDIKSPLFLVAAAVCIVAQFVSNGSRGSALALPLIVALVWAMRRQRIPWKIGLLLIPLMFVSIGLLGAVRTSSWSRSTADQTLAHTGWGESFALAQREIAARQSVSANVPVVERALSLGDGLLLGRSYMAAISAFIPRGIWHDKPRAVGSIYAQVFLGAPRSGISIPVSAEAEMYWNFGLLGVVLLSILYGALIRRAYNYYWRRHWSPFALVMYLIFITSFQFSSDRLVTFEQETFLLFICYLASFFGGSTMPNPAMTHHRFPAEPRRALRNLNS